MALVENTSPDSVKLFHGGQVHILDESRHEVVEVLNPLVSCIEEVASCNTVIVIYILSQ